MFNPKNKFSPEVIELYSLMGEAYRAGMESYRGGLSFRIDRLRLERQTEFPLVCEVAHFGNYPPGYAELTAEIDALEAELDGAT